ncbi:MAG: 30S ribosomal protein S2 [Candidatus Paceibacterota bacterium]
MIVVDPRHDQIAIKEAQELKLPIFAIMSSDNDASQVTYPVVANDALQASVDLMLGELTTAYTTGKATYTPKPTPRTGARRRPARE